MTLSDSKRGFLGSGGSFSITSRAAPASEKDYMGR